MASFYMFWPMPLVQWWLSISALTIKFVPHDPEDTKHWTVYIDPTLSIIIVIIITISALPLFKDTSYILLQTIPSHLEIT